MYLKAYIQDILKAMHIPIMVKAGFEDGLLLYLFQVEVDIEQEVDTSGDPDNECDDFTYEDPFDHIDELHVEPSKNWALEYWAKN